MVRTGTIIVESGLNGVDRIYEVDRDGNRRNQIRVRSPTPPR